MYYSERFNAYSHLIGTILAIIGTVFLIIKSVHTGYASKIVASCIYSASLIILYAGSTIYHSIYNPNIKAIFQKIDHCVIYILIAGSYTPFTLVTLSGGWGWSIFGISWGLALFGIIQDLTLGKKTRVLSLIIYMVMGWIIVVAIKPLVQQLETFGLIWLILGGLFYSIGIYWFINDERIPHGHGIWHIFVLLGSLCQFICIYYWVI